MRDNNPNDRAAIPHIKGERMKIKINEIYTLHNDGLCLWITRKVEFKDEKRTGEFRDVRVSGYHNRLYDLLESLERKEFLRLKNSAGAKELFDLAERQKTMHEDLKQFCTDLAEKIESGGVEI